MKLFFIAIILLVGAFALADCPNLAGHYECTDTDGGKYSTTFKQKVVDRLEVYTVDGVDMVVSGLPVPMRMSNDGQDFKGSVTYRCEGGNFLSVVTGELSQGGAPHGSSAILSTTSGNGTDGYTRVDDEEFVFGNEVTNKSITTNCLPAK